MAVDEVTVAIAVDEAAQYVPAKRPDPAPSREVEPVRRIPLEDLRRGMSLYDWVTLTLAYAPRQSSDWHEAYRLACRINDRADREDNWRLR